MAAAMPHLSFAALANPRRGNAWLVACVVLAVGVIAVEIINPNLLPHLKPTPAYRPYGDGGRQALMDKAPTNTRVYAAEVVRTIDGDTFVARVRRGSSCWPRAASCFLTSRPTNIQDASTPMSRPTAPTISRPRCSQAAG